MTHPHIYYYIAVEKQLISANQLFMRIGAEIVGESEKYNLYYYDLANK